MSEIMHRNIVIVGAGSAGKLLKKDIVSSQLHCHVLGFVDDKANSRSKSLLGQISDIPKLVTLFKIDEIVIAIPSASGKLIRRILLENMKNNIPIKILPRNQKIIHTSKVQYSDVKDICEEDFLGDSLIRKNIVEKKDFYKDKVVLITGGAGSIGSDIVRQLIELNVRRVIVYDNSEYLMYLLEQKLKSWGTRTQCELILGNILHEHKLERVMKKNKPDIVFHAAAYKHVHLMEDNVDEAIYNNVIGTKCVVDAALRNNVKLFTFISTDKVVNPKSVMGASKKLCECYIESRCKEGTMKFNIVRFGNVINSNGSVLPLFERQIKEQKSITITDAKMKRFFMSIHEASSLVIESTARGKANRIHILDMGELISIYEVALCYIRSKGFIPLIDITVAFIGLRKGEKLVEELYTTTEFKNMTKTNMYHIFSIKNREACSFDVMMTIQRLEEMLNKGIEQKKLQNTLKAVFTSLKT